MNKDFWMDMVIMAIFQMLTALVIFFFYNRTIALNFNLPEFSYWEILLGLISGRMFIRSLFHRFTKEE